MGTPATRSVAPGKRPRTLGLSGSGPPAPIQQKADADAVTAFESATSGAGSEIPYRQQMEQSFGQSFSGVTAHLGQSSAVNALGADAAASGDQIAFSSTNPSRTLVAHELTHVVQARGASPSAGAPVVSSPSQSAEHEADSTAPRAARGESVTVDDRHQAWINLGDEKPGDEALAQPENHPEWPRFRAGAEAIGMDPGRAERLWALIIDGLRDNKPGNFDIVADELFEYMRVGRGEMALWSGGLGVSDYAVGKGKKTLESRDFYKLTDGLALYKNWERVRQLWAALSARFVSQCQGQVVCYLRNYGENTIFGEIEHNILLSLGDEVKITYHALCGPDGQIQELDGDGQPLPPGQEHVFSSLGDATRALALYRQRSAGS